MGGSAAPDAVAEGGSDVTVDGGLTGAVDAAPDVVAVDAACTVIGFQDDAENCGYCGNSCGPSGACTVGRCITVLTTNIAFSPVDLAVDSNSVYFTSSDLNGVYKMPLTGGVPTAIVAPPLGSTYSQYLTLAGGNVYWTIQGHSAAYQAVCSVATDGGAAGFVSTTDLYPQFITNDGVGVYWTDTLRLRRAEIADGGVTTLPVTFQGNPATDYPVAIAVDDNYVYWGNSNNTIFRASKADGSGVQLLNPTMSDSVWGLTVDATNVYFTTTAGNNTGTVYSVPIDGGVPTPLYAGEASPQDIVSDATSLYWVDTSTSQIRKGAKSGGSATTLAQATDSLKSKQGCAGPVSYTRLTRLVVDNVFVYWLDAEGGCAHVLRTAKD